MPKLEADITKKAITYLNSLDNTLAYKRFAGPGRRGKPDITGAHNGRRLEIEMKAGYNMPTDMQRSWIKKWKRFGAISGCAWSIDDVKAIVSGALTCEYCGRPIESGRFCSEQCAENLNAEVIRTN